SNKTVEGNPVIYYHAIASSSTPGTVDRCHIEPGTLFCGGSFIIINCVVIVVIIVIL
ncbi:hypothetical protein LINPERPRIM_LOCUS8758, partial [Linum perenne]